MLPSDTPSELPVLDGVVGAVCVLTSPAPMVTMESADKVVEGREMEVTSRASEVVPLTWAELGLSPRPVRELVGLAAEARDVEGNGLAVEDDVDPTPAVACSWLRAVVVSTVTVPCPTLVSPAVDQSTGDVRTAEGWDVATMRGSVLLLLLLLGPLLDSAAEEPAREGDSLIAADLAVTDTELALPLIVPTLVVLES